MTTPAEREERLVGIRERLATFNDRSTFVYENDREHLSSFFARETTNLKCELEWLLGDYESLRAELNAQTGGPYVDE